MYQVKSRVIKNEEVAEGYFRLSLECPEVAVKAVPGQFVMLRVGNSYDPLLRRPFSIHRINKSQQSGIEILYKVIGKGTGMMAHIKAGEVPSLIGPLGNGFSINGELGEALVVGGGIGAAPLLALAEKLTGKGEGEDRKVSVFLGGRSKEDILCVEEFKGIGAEVHIATDDGSLGHKGFVTELLEKYLSRLTGDSPDSTAPLHFARKSGTVPSATSHVSRLFSCGPHLMSKRVAEIAKKHNTPCQVSLEAHMACGVGACLGCVIKVRGQEPGVRSRGGVTPPLQPATGCFVPCDTQLPETSFKRVCMEGPVFDAEEVVWD